MSVPPIKHVVIYSSGRSGSNRLLDMFDFHPWTNCRNEVSELDAAIGRLPMVGADLDALPDSFGELWANAVAQSRLTKSDRDRFDRPKAYLRPAAWQVLSRLYARRRIRRHGLMIKTDEWPISALALHKRDLERILPVLKINGRPAWFTSASQNDLQYLVHTMRHPLGYLNSWYGRFITFRFKQPERDYEITKAAIRTYLEGMGVAQLPEAYSEFNTCVAQLYKWRMDNESVFEACKHSKTYLPITYEKISADQAAAARDVFAFAGLELSDAHECQLASMQNTLFRRPHVGKIDPKIAQDASAVALDGLSLWPLWDDAETDGVAQKPSDETREAVQ